MSTEHLTPETPSAQDKEWEATMLSFVDRNESSYSPTAPGKKLPIRRRTLTVILSSVGTVLIAAVLLVVTLFIKPQPHNLDEDPIAPDVTTTRPSIPLLDKTGGTEKTESNQTGTTNVNPVVPKATLQKVNIQNSNESYSILYNDSAKTYVIEGYEDLALAADLILTLKTHTETIQASEKITAASALSAYGLDKPQATADITYSDGSVAKLHIGNMTPSETGFYGQFNDDEDVYIFDSDSVSMFRFRAAAFVNTLLVATPIVKSSDKYGMAVLQNVRYSGTAHPTPLALRRSTHMDSKELTYFSYIISSPYVRATSDATSNALGQFKSLTAEQALFLHPTDEQKQRLGFNNPLIKINATMAVETEEEGEPASDDEILPKIYYNSTDYVITVGSTNENGDYVVMVNDVDAIFLVSKADYTHLFDVTYQSAVNPFLFFKNIETISRISIRMDGKNNDFHLKHSPEKEQPDAQMTVTHNGTIYPTADFRELYGLMLTLERYGSADTNRPSGECILEMSLYDTNNELYLHVKYYDTSGSLCIVETSEGEVFTTRHSYVSFFIQQVHNYLEGKDVLINT